MLTDMEESKDMPFDLSWETIAVLLAFAVLVLIVLSNSQVMDRILSFIPSNWEL
jgi:hypothetical protein